MPSFTIQKILEDAVKKNQIFQKNEESQKWFYERTRRTNITPSKLIREYSQAEMRNSSQIQIGCLYFFFYHAKGEDTKQLPFYDRTPMIFVTDVWKDALGRTQYAGINLHYLPYKQRALLMDALLDLENTANIMADKKLKISYGILKKAAANRWFRPTYKRYLKSQMRSRLVKVPFEEWSTAVLLPVASWHGASQKEVWADSIRRLNPRKKK